MSFEIPMPAGANRAKKCLGRGRGTGLGTQAGKGHKGQKARAGGGVRPGFEGGQTPLYRRLPMRGFSNEPHRIRYEVVNLEDLDVRFENGETVNRFSLAERGLLRTGGGTPIKLLGRGELKKKLTIEVDAASKSAAEAVAKAGGVLKLAE